MSKTNYFHSKPSNSPLNLSQNTYAQSILSILSFQGKAKLKGSYPRLGKDKSCDCDLFEIIYWSPSFWSNWNQYFTRLEQAPIQLLELDLRIDHPDIIDILSHLGHLNGLYEIQLPTDSLFHDSKKMIALIQSKSKIPKTIQQKIIDLYQTYQKDSSLYAYMKLYMTLRELKRESWTIEEVKKKKKVYLSYEMDLEKNQKMDRITIECLYDDFRSSITLEIIYPGQKKKSMSDLDTLDFGMKYLWHNDFYHLLKKMSVFLKWYYYHHMKSEKVIEHYNEIYEFREKVTPYYIELCKQYVQELKKKNRVLKKIEQTMEEMMENTMYSFELMCSNLYNQIVTSYRNELKMYIRFS